MNESKRRGERKLIELGGVLRKPQLQKCPSHDGNWTWEFHVKRGDTHHYTIAETTN